MLIRQLQKKTNVPQNFKYNTFYVSLLIHTECMANVSIVNVLILLIKPSIFLPLFTNLLNFKSAILRPEEAGSTGLLQNTSQDFCD